MKILLMLIGAILGIFMLASSLFFRPKKTYKVEIADVGHFWQAYDSLKNVRSYDDSLRVIEALYLARMTPYGKKYIEGRKYTAAEYIKSLRKYPRYFIQLRTKTAMLSTHLGEIDTAFKKLGAIIPNYNVPDVCFAIGCFRGGGTITKRKDAVLVGCEIAMADSAMDISEFTGTLHRLFSSSGGGISALIGHESVHCQQWNGQNNSLLSIALAEGTADFLANKFLHANPDKPMDYAVLHECELWKEFEPQINREDVSQWFYNTSLKESRPADLGYFMGRRICEAYYNNQSDKKKAIVFLLNRGNYREVLAQSDYHGNCKN